jgi:EpsI family protein
MPSLLSRKGFIKGNAALILSAVLLAQAALVYGFTRREVVPYHTPLAQLEPSFGGWQQVQEHPIEQEVQDVLKADDVLNRSYAGSSAPVGANLFVAFFKTQRSGVAPHSPKNCLPGSGWTATVSDIIKVDNVPGRTEPLETNRYIVQRGEAKSLVLYWYQSRDRTVASEYTAKFFVVADAMRYNRTDTALVRVVVPLPANDPEMGERAALDFVRAVYAPLRKHFPL